MAGSTSFPGSGEQVPVASIPFVLHQIGRDAQVPAHLEPFRRSWLHWNPGLELKLWTDASLRAFIAEQARPFLPLFDGFPRGVCRADLGRYLLLQHFGGIYADLDCQCLQPLEPLLAGRELVVAPEPAEHDQGETAQLLGLQRIVSPAFLASVPGHPLWSEALEALLRLDPEAVRSNEAVVAATGPGLLTRLFEARPAYAAELVPAPWLHPFSKDDCWRGRLFDPAFWSERSRGAYVAHHWDGSWFRPAGGRHAGVPAQAPVSVHEPKAGSAPPVAASPASQPLISCLMVTRGRAQQARLAIRSFLDQTYAARELIVLDDDPDPQLADWIAQQHSPLLRLVKLPDQGLPLGHLRNLAVDQARGDYVCQWDDDDLHDPVRLEVQLKVLLSTDCQASLLARWMIWWPERQRLALSCYRDWEGSLLCRRACMPRYPDWRRREDTRLLDVLRRSVRLARIDMPRLYLYVVHGANTFDAPHFEEHWQRATARWQGPELERLLPELQRRLPLEAYPACG